MSSRVYVGNLPGNVRERDLDDIFYKVRGRCACEGAPSMTPRILPQYGRIRDVSVKFPPRGPAYAFVEFERERDAEDAVRARDGYDFDGFRIRVELSRGSRMMRPRVGGRGPPRRSDYRVVVSNLPRSASWQVRARRGAARARAVCGG